MKEIEHEANIKVHTSIRTLKVFSRHVLTNQYIYNITTRDPN